MRNIKTLLRLMGAAALSTVAVSSVVACGDAQTKTSVLNGKYATLLGWYHDENTSLITQKLTQANDKYDIVADNTALITGTNFRAKLLIAGSAADKFKAKDTDAAAFLAELGFESGNENNDYQPEEVEKIKLLVAKVTSSKPGEIAESGTTDFKVAAGTCQVDIMDNNLASGKVVKTYTINTIKNDALAVKTVVITDIIAFGKSGLKLTADQGFKKAEPIASFKLELMYPFRQTQFDSLVSLLKTTVTTKFFAACTGGAIITGNFTNTKVFLEITFGNVVLTPRIDCEIPTA